MSRNRTVEKKIQQLANVDISRMKLPDRVNALVRAGFEVRSIPSISPSDNQVVGVLQLQSRGIRIDFSNSTTRGYFLDRGREYVQGRLGCIIGTFQDYEFTKTASGLMLALWGGKCTAAGTNLILHGIQDPQLNVTHYVVLPDYEWKEK